MMSQQTDPDWFLSYFHMLWQKCQFLNYGEFMDNFRTIFGQFLSKFWKISCEIGLWSDTFWDHQQKICKEAQSILLSEALLQIFRTYRTMHSMARANLNKSVIPPQHQSTYLGVSKSASIKIPPFRPHFIKFSKTVFL